MKCLCCSHELWRLVSPPQPYQGGALMYVGITVVHILCMYSVYCLQLFRTANIKCKIAFEIRYLLLSSCKMRTTENSSFTFVNQRVSRVTAKFQL